MYNNLMKQSLTDKIFIICVYSILMIIGVIVLYPLLYILSSSFSSASAVISGKVWLFPVDFTTVGYEAVFMNNKVLYGYANSIFYAVVGTTLNVILTIMAGYALAKKGLWGKGVIMFLFTFTMLFDGGLVPTYLTVKTVGLIDSRWALIIPKALAVYQVIIARTFFQSSIPTELFESAQLDGCKDIKFLLKIAVPLSKALIAVITLFYAVIHWNSYFDALIYLNDTSKFPLQIVLRNILIQYSFSKENLDASIAQTMRKSEVYDILKYSLIVIASFPVLLIYPFVQKHFVKGVMIGSLKG